MVHFEMDIKSGKSEIARYITTPHCARLILRCFGPAELSKKAHEF